MGFSRADCQNGSQEDSGSSFWVFLGLAGKMALVQNVGKQHIPDLALLSRDVFWIFFRGRILRIGILAFQNPGRRLKSSSEPVWLDFHRNLRRLLSFWALFSIAIYVVF